MCGAVGQDPLLPVVLHAALHSLEDGLEPPIQGQEVGLGEDRAERVLQQRLPHHVTQLIVLLGQQLQMLQSFLLDSERTKWLGSGLAP